MLSLNHRRVRCVTPLEVHRLCYTVRMDQDHLLQASRGSILVDHHEKIDSFLVVASDLSAMKSQYFEDHSLAKEWKPQRRNS